jgi:hypothetical protein
MYDAYMFASTLVFNIIQQRVGQVWGRLVYVHTYTCACVCTPAICMCTVPAKGLNQHNDCSCDCTLVLAFSWGVYNLCRSLAAWWTRISDWLFCSAPQQCDANVQSHWHIGQHGWKVAHIPHQSCLSWGRRRGFGSVGFQTYLCSAPQIWRPVGIGCRQRNPCSPTEVAR